MLSVFGPCMNFVAFVYSVEVMTTTHSPVSMHMYMRSMRRHAGQAVHVGFGSTHTHTQGERAQNSQCKCVQRRFTWCTMRLPARQPPCVPMFFFLFRRPNPYSVY
ncbi:hypothetical protein Dimus_019856 [Dionaea muscipula]